MNPAHDIANEAQRQIVAFCLQAGTGARAAELVSVEEFHHPGWRAAFGAVLRLEREGRTVGPVTVGEVILAAGAHDPLKHYGGAVEALRSAWNDLVSLDTLEEHARIVRGHALKAKLRQASQDLEKAIESDHDVEDLPARFARRLGDLATGPGTAPAAAPTFPLLAIKDVPEIVEQEWLVEGLLPVFPEGAAGYLIAPAKSRKSMLIAELALSIATGTPALGVFPVRRRGAVVGFFAEDPKGETSRRINRLSRARGVPTPENLHLIDTTGLALDNPEQQERLLATLRAVPDLAFVWLDPMVRLHRVNDNKAEELGPIHTFLRFLSRSLPGTVILLAHHANKEGGARGSTDYDAFGDFNLYARKKDSHTTEVHTVEFRGGPPGRPFRFSVEDGAGESGPTMRLVHAWIEDDEEDRSVALEEQIAAFKLANPGASGKDAKAHLRRLGVSFHDGAFYKVWRAVRP